MILEKYIRSDVNQYETAPFQCPAPLVVTYSHFSNGHRCNEYKWLNVYRSYGMDTNVVRNQLKLEGFLLQHQDTIEALGGQKPYRIPTGFFIQSLAFITASDVNITDYIWQKYPKDFPQDFTKRIVFPEEVNSVSRCLDKLYESSGEWGGIQYE